MKTNHFHPIYLYCFMESSRESENTQNRGRSNTREEGSGGTPYSKVSNKAVSAEGYVKKDMASKDSGLAISMTVVGETVTFTQNFNF